MANIFDCRLRRCGGVYWGTELTKQGHKVFGLRRNIDALPECIIPIEANLASTINDLPKKVDYVFYMASAVNSKTRPITKPMSQDLKNLLKSE